MHAQKVLLFVSVKCAESHTFQKGMAREHTVHA